MKLIKTKIFKTRINEKDDNENKSIINNNYNKYLDDYPKTKEFMKKYKGRFLSEPEKMEVVDVSKIDFKKVNIPYKILEKNKNIERLKYLLKIKNEQIREREKREIERVFKEFYFNNYGQAYRVSYETVIGAICGEERKNEMIVYYCKLEKEYRDGIKMTTFHSNFNRPGKK